MQGFHLLSNPSASIHAWPADKLTSRFHFVCRLAPEWNKFPSANWENPQSTEAEVALAG